MLERLFKLRENNTNPKREVLAGLTTFLTMVYIAFVNPQILSGAGVDPGAVFVATCIIVTTFSIIMGLVANYPIALAPGMGLNAYFTYGIVLSDGFSWQIALGAVFLSGILNIILSILPVRELIIDAIPYSLKMAIVAGVGFFLGFIGFQNAGLVVPHEVTMVQIGNLSSIQSVLVGVGFVMIAILTVLRIPGAIILSVISITFLGILFGVSPFYGLVAPPPSILPTFLQLDIAGAFNLGLLAIVLTLTFVNLFDAAGTFVGICHEAGLLSPDKRVARLRPALLADSASSVFGAMLGTSPVTSYLESVAGVKAGGRTGLTAVVVGLLFLLVLPFGPLAQSIPNYATAPALLFVSCMMARSLKEIDWDDIAEYVPAMITALAMPLTYSIAHGIAFGFISYTIIKIFTGKFRALSPIMVILTILFAIKFATT